MNRTSCIDYLYFATITKNIFMLVFMYCNYFCIFLEIFYVYKAIKDNIFVLYFTVILAGKKAPLMEVLTSLKYLHFR